MSTFWAFATLLATFSSQFVLSDEIECFVHGECTQSPYVQHWTSVLDAQDCLEKCQGLEGCEYFTYYGLDDYCMGFSACVELSLDTCQECYSGSSSCPDLQCWIKGSCYGIFITQEHVSSDDECLDTCKSDPSCDWFTYDDADGACMILDSCDEFNTDDCDTCWSGQRQCEERQGKTASYKQDFTKIMLVAGPNDQVEVIDLNSEVQNCLSPTNYPFEVVFPLGTMFNGVPLVCGGYNEDNDISANECYQYYHEDNIWIPTSRSMLQRRVGAKASMVDSATWLISGGARWTGDALDTTEIYQNGIFSFGPTLPTTRRLHCQVTLNSSHIAILGGYNGTEYLYDFYLLDWENQDWTRMPDVPVLLYSDPCGLIENSVNGQELVVLENPETCYIFNFRDQSWRRGPNMANGTSVRADEMVAQMDKNFYVLGGQTTESSLIDDVYEFDAENYQWVRQSFTLSTPRGYGVAIPVPNNIVNCP